ncbi:MAG: MFS transporter [Cyclobacteriaceae bacterium]
MFWSVLVVIPPLSGWLADRNLNFNGKFFTTYQVGINGTAMIFIVVATLTAIGPESAMASMLPFMIILWLIGMSVFLAPAYSMLSSFADKRKLPIAMGVIILFTDMIYALEPLVVTLVQFLGETITFVTGGILVLGSGFLFYRLSSGQVTERIQRTSQARDTRSEWKTVIGIALTLGFGRAFLVEYIPWQSQLEGLSGKELSFVLLGLAAIVAFLCSRFVIRTGIHKMIRYSTFIMLLGISIMAVCGPNPVLFLAGCLLLAGAFGILNVSGLPYVFSRISARRATFAIGVFLGASAVFEGIFEILIGLY